VLIVLESGMFNYVSRYYCGFLLSRKKKIVVDDDVLAEE